MSSRRDGHEREWLGPFPGDRRQERRIARARRKVVAQREILPVVAEEPFERCSGCGERYCDGCRTFGAED